MSAVATLFTQQRRAGAAGRVVAVRCRARRDDRPDPEEHAGWTLALVQRGTFDYRAADTNRTHTLRPGWMLLGRRRTTYECSHDHDGGDDCLALTIDPDVLDEVAVATRGCHATVFPRPVLAPVTRLAALMQQLAAGTADFDETVYDVAAAALAHLHAAPPAPVDVRRDHRERIDAALVEIERRSGTELALAELAATAGLSPFHFLRVFRRLVGTTPHQYVVGARLRHAAMLLANTPRPVTEIAYDVGFADLSNFVRTFHRAVGCSPSAFRTGRRTRGQA